MSISVEHAGYAQTLADWLGKEVYLYKQCASGQCAGAVECTCNRHDWKVSTTAPSYTRLTVIKPSKQKESIR